MHFGAPHVPPLHDLLWLLYPSRCPFNPEMDHISHLGWIQNFLLCHFGTFWWILVHLMCIVQPCDPSMTCSDSYPLSSVHPNQKWIIIVTQDKFKTHCSAMLWWTFWCILVHFGDLNGQPHGPSVLNFYQVINNMYPTHKKLLNVTNPAFLTQEILI